MNRLLLGAAVVICVGLLVWLLRSSLPASAEALDGSAEAREISPGPENLDLPGSVAVSSTVQTEGRRVASPASREEAQTRPPPAIDKSARDWVHLIVQDRRGAPIGNAEITMTGLRTKRESGSHWAWPRPAEPSLGRTAQDGTAKLWFPVWVNPDDETGELTFRVSHPDYVTREVDGFAIGPEPRVVVLEQGAFVIVSGWLHSPSEVITQVEPFLTNEAKLEKSGWQRIRDGRLSTANVSVGTHAIYLRHDGGSRGLFFSDVTRFTLAEAEQKELHLQLHPAQRFDGRLEDEVPRPVRNGKVRLNLLVGTLAENEARMSRDFRAPINADGNFSIVDLPPGQGQIIGLCDGWASESVEDDELRDADPDSPLGQLRARIVENFGELERGAQRVDPASEGIFVLRMEPAASLKVILNGPDGKPVKGAVVNCWPNVRWSNGYSTMFLDHGWSATSDAQGAALVTNMPSGRTWYGVWHPDLDLPLENADRTREGLLEAGKTLEVVFDLVVKEK